MASSKIAPSQRRTGISHPTESHPTNQPTNGYASCGHGRRATRRSLEVYHADIRLRGIIVSARTITVVDCGRIGSTWYRGSTVHPHAGLSWAILSLWLAHGPFVRAVYRQKNTIIAISSTFQETRLHQDGCCHVVRISCSFRAL